MYLGKQNNFKMVTPKPKHEFLGFLHSMMHVVDAIQEQVVYSYTGIQKKYVGQKSYFAVILLPSTSMNERLTTNQSLHVQTQSWRKFLLVLVLDRLQNYSVPVLNLRKLLVSVSTGSRKSPLFGSGFRLFSSSVLTIMNFFTKKVPKSPQQVVDFSAQMSQRRRCLKTEAKQ